MNEHHEEPHRHGAIGALIGEYVRAALDLKTILRDTPNEEYEEIVDPGTADTNCRSIRTIIGHVINAGYQYADSIRDHFGIECPDHDTSPPDLEHAEDGIDEMVEYTVRTFEGHWDISDEYVSHTQLRTRWGVDWGLQQILEHAIVHLLRHRRQVEHFREHMNPGDILD
jgi:uncharacterized damage-inducible protein DinB